MSTYICPECGQVRDPSMERSAEELARQHAAACEAVARYRTGMLPADVEPLQAAVSLPCTWFGLRESFAHVQIDFNERGVACSDPNSRICLLHRPWHAIASIEVEAADDVTERLRKLRASSFGLLSTRRPGAPEKSYVIVRSTTRAEFFFEIAAEADRVRDRLEPVMSWFEENSGAIQKL